MFPEGKQILVVDDPASGAETQGVLRTLGAQVTLAYDPGEALASA